MRGGPWTIIAITCVFALIVKVVGPQFMKNRKPFDLRPYMIVYNGMLFGMNGVGFLVSSCICSCISSP